MTVSETHALHDRIARVLYGMNPHRVDGVPLRFDDHRHTEVSPKWLANAQAAALCAVLEERDWLFLQRVSDFFWATSSDGEPPLPQLEAVLVRSWPDGFTYRPRRAASAPGSSRPDGPSSGGRRFAYVGSPSDGGGW